MPSPLPASAQVIHGLLLIPLILNARPDFMTLPVVIASLVSNVHVFFNLMMAICLLALAPTVILVALLQNTSSRVWRPARSKADGLPAERQGVMAFCRPGRL